MKGNLTVEDHNRDVAGLTYVYPVVSRRAGGVSVGINLNPNNACNWHCVYCQVPDLQRGRAPQIDVDRLERELAHMLHDIRDGDFMAVHVDEALRRLCDIAFSGNGEPTSAAGFADIVARVGAVRERFGFGDEVPLRLITNGSLVGQEGVLEGIRRLAGFGGEVWFKVDAVSVEDIRRINGVERDAAHMARQLARCAGQCPTWVQTCLFGWDGMPPDEAAIEAYLAFLRRAAADGVRGVLLYGVARPSLQPEAGRVSRLSREWLEGVGRRIVNETGLTAGVSP
ncbi:MAG: radical SAM protein [Rhodocyclaceae bacterium]|nr:radical SAM protein [Rhodocyclaceae bacterium]